MTRMSLEQAVTPCHVPASWALGHERRRSSHHPSLSLGPPSRHRDLGWSEGLLKGLGVCDDATCWDCSVTEARADKGEPAPVGSDREVGAGLGSLGVSLPLPWLLGPLEWAGGGSGRAWVSLLKQHHPRTWPFHL